MSFPSKGAENIFVLRTILGKTEDEFADYIGVPRERIKDITSGKCEIDEDTLDAIVDKQPLVCKDTFRGYKK